GEVDDHHVVAGREAGDAVAAAAHGDLEVVAACEADRRDHVGGACTAHDDSGSPVVVGTVPDSCCLLVAVAAGCEDLPPNRLAKLRDGRFLECRNDRLTHLFLRLYGHGCSVIVKAIGGSHIGHIP